MDESTSSFSVETERAVLRKCKVTPSACMGYMDAKGKIDYAVTTRILSGWHHCPPNRRIRELDQQASGEQ